MDWNAITTSLWTGLSAPQAAFALASVLLGYAVLGLAGFGSALVIVPLLSWQWPLAVVVPVVLIIDVPVSLLHTGLNLRRVAWGELPPLVLPAVVGAALAVLLARHAQGPLLPAVLGLYVAWVGWSRLTGRQGLAVPWLAGRWPTGVLVGAVETLFGTAGPLVVAWLSRRLHDPQALRATVPVMIVVFATIAIAGAGIAGALSNPRVWLAVIGLLPVGAAGVVIGHALSRGLAGPRLRQVIHGLLLASGLALLARALAGAGG